jgi:hypothetical protein
LSSRVIVPALCHFHKDAVHTGEIDWSIAGAASLRIAVEALPLTTDSPTDAVGFANPEKLPGKSPATIADDDKVPSPEAVLTKPLEVKFVILAIESCALDGILNVGLPDTPSPFEIEIWLEVPVRVLGVTVPRLVLASIPLLPGSTIPTLPPGMIASIALSTSRWNCCNGEITVSTGPLMYGKYPNGVSAIITL